MNLIEKLEKEIKDLVDLDLQVKNIRSYMYYALSALNKIDCLIKKDSNFVYQISLSINKVKQLTNQWVSEILTETNYKKQDLADLQKKEQDKNGSK